MKWQKEMKNKDTIMSRSTQLKKKRGWIFKGFQKYRTRQPRQISSTPSNISSLMKTKAKGFHSKGSPILLKVSLIITLREYTFQNLFIRITRKLIKMSKINDENKCQSCNKFLDFFVNKP
jgi:hypothetical protein